MLVDVAAETAALLETLTDAQWDAPSLCAQWRIRDVVGHLVSGTTTPLATFARTMLAARGQFHDANTADARRVATEASTSSLIAAVADDHRAGVGRILPPRLLLGDHVVHLLDIAHALDLDRTIAIPGDVLAAVLVTELRIPNPFVPAARLGRGLSVEATDIGWRHGRGESLVHGRATDLITALAGRPATLPRLTGSGVAPLRARIETWLA
jgi:uncharacterized protein (TIGR03083 family)